MMVDSLESYLLNSHYAPFTVLDSELLWKAIEVVPRNIMVTIYRD